MKKLLTLMVSILVTIAAMAEVKTVYVNPLKQSTDINQVIADRLYKKGILGLTKAKTISVSSGTKTITPGTPEAEKYDYILTMDIVDVIIEEAASIGNILGMFSSEKEKDPDWQAKISTDIKMVNAKDGTEYFKVNLKPSAVNKDKSLALFHSTANFDYDMTDMTDDAFSIGGDVDEAVETKKNVVKKIRVNVGSNHGARKGQSYQILKNTDGKRELLGAAKCEQVLNGNQSILSVNGKKDADKIIYDLLNQNDGSYTVEVRSCSKSSFLHDNFKDLDKMFTKEGRSHYMDPFGRTTKVNVAFLTLAVNDDTFRGNEELFQDRVLKGLDKVSSIKVVPKIYSDIETATNDGIHGLIEVSIDKVLHSTEKTKEGKTKYKTEVFYTLTGIDATNNKWIEMKSFNELGSSTEGQAKSDDDALNLIDNKVQKFCEDVFPVAGTIVESTKVKNNSCKEAKINIGTDLGVRNGMTFDIFEQRKEGDDDARFLLGEGKVTKDALSSNSATLKIKGKDNGDERLYDLISNADENTEIIIVSKATYDILEKGLNFLGRD